MTGHPYRLTGSIGRWTLGLIVLQVDETIEIEFRRLLSPETALYVTRIPSGDALTPDSIATMEDHLPKAAGLLPPAARFDAVAYACTSGTALIGPDRVADLIRGACHTAQVTTPLGAATRALRALGATRIGLVSPYVPSVAGPIRQAFENAGFQVTATLSFGEEVEAKVARIDPASVAGAAREVARTGRPDAIFLSCTNLRTLEILPELEAELGIPVLSSNQTLAWDMARLARAPVPPSAPGRLFSA